MYRRFATKIKPLIPKPVLSRWSSSGEDHKRIARNVVIVGIFVVLAKLAGAIKEIAVAWRYGVSEIVDAYLLVFTLVQWPTATIGVVLISVVVPLAARIKADAARDLETFRAELLGLTLLAGAGLGLLAYVGLPWLIEQPLLALNSTQIEHAKEVSRYFAWLLPLGVVIRFAASWTLVANRHLNSLAEGVPAVTVLIAVVMAGGLAPLVWGTVVGFVFQALVLTIPLVIAREINYPVIRLRSSHWTTFFSAFWIMMLGETLMSTVTLLDQFFAARMDPGSLSVLGYANRFLALILTLGGITIARAILPVLSRRHAAQSSGVPRIAFRWALLMAVFGLCVAVVAWLVAPLLIELLLQRGQFDANSTKAVTEVFRAGVFQVPFCFSSLVLTHALLSRSQHHRVALVGTSALLIKVGAALLLVPEFGLSGLLLATAVVYFCTTLIAGVLLRLP